MVDGKSISRLNLNLFSSYIPFTLPLRFYSDEERPFFPYVTIPLLSFTTLQNDIVLWFRLYILSDSTLWYMDNFIHLTLMSM